MLTDDIYNWEKREAMFTEKDREAISKAKLLPWYEIDESSAETEAGKYELHIMASNGYHNEEYYCGIL